MIVNKFNLLFILIATLILTNLAYAKNNSMIKSNSSRFSISQLEDAGLPEMAKSMIKSNNFNVEENDNELKFTDANSSGYCVFTIQSNNKQGSGSIQLQNVQCSAQ